MPSTLEDNIEKLKKSVPGGCAIAAFIFLVLIALFVFLLGRTDCSLLDLMSGDCKASFMDLLRQQHTENEQRQREAGNQKGKWTDVMVNRQLWGLSPDGTQLCQDTRVNGKETRTCMPVNQ